MSFEDALRRAVHVLKSSRVPYLLTGAQAVAVYGEPRTTQDIDIVVAGARSTDLPRVARAFQRVGFRVTSDLTYGHNTVFDTRSRYRLDVKIKEEPEKSVELEVLGERIRFTTPEALLALKLDYASEKDLRDAQSILARKPLQLDVSALRRYLRGKPREQQQLRRLLEQLSDRKLLRQFFHS